MASIQETCRLLRCQNVPLRVWLLHRHRPFAGSLQIAIAALLASLFILIDHLRLSLPNSVSIVTTALGVMDRDSPESEFAKGESRLTGTALAMGGALFISALWPNGSDLGALLFMLVFSMVARFTQCNPRFTNISVSFMITLFPILFTSSTNEAATLTAATNSRAMSATLGIVIASFCSLLWPIRSRGMIGYHLAKLIGRDLISLVTSAFELGEPARGAVRATRSVESRARKECDHLRRMVEDAKEEPELFKLPFLHFSYLALVDASERVLINASCCNRMSEVMHSRAQEDPKCLERIFSDTTSWYLLRDRIISRLQLAVDSLYQRGTTGPHDSPLIDAYDTWVEGIQDTLNRDSLPASAHISMWAFLLSCQFLVDDIMRLRHAVDCLHENSQSAQKQSFPVALCPLVRPPTVSQSLL